MISLAGLTVVGPSELDRLVIDGVVRNRNRGPLHEALGQLHGGASQSRRNRAGIGFELEGHGAQESLHIRRQLFPGHAGLPACAEQQHGRPAHEGIPAGCAVE
jgi:hypothetical protein